MLSYASVKLIQTALNSVKENKDDICLLLRKHHAWNRTEIWLQRKPSVVLSLWRILKGQEIKPRIFTGRTDAEIEAPILWPPDAKSQLIGKDTDAGKNWRHEEKGATEDEMVGLYHPLSGHEFEQILGDSEGQGSLTCGKSMGIAKSDTTEQLNNNKSAGSQAPSSSPASPTPANHWRFVNRLALVSIRMFTYWASVAENICVKGTMSRRGNSEAFGNTRPGLHPCLYLFISWATLGILSNISLTSYHYLQSDNW